MLPKCSILLVVARTTGPTSRWSQVRQLRRPQSHRLSVWKQGNQWNETYSSIKTRRRCDPFHRFAYQPVSVKGITTFSKSVLSNEASLSLLFRGKPFSWKRPGQASGEKFNDPAKWLADNCLLFRGLAAYQEAWRIVSSYSLILGSRARSLLPVSLGNSKPLFRRLHTRTPPSWHQQEIYSLRCRVTFAD